jgi:NitT/TauT family transport system substrate-binding protein
LKNFKKMLGVASGVLMAFAALGQAQAEPFRLIVTDLETPLVPNSVMDLALQNGYFEAEGVDVELVRVQQTPSAIAALQAGEGEMSNIGLDALLQLVARGNSELRAVISPNKSLPFLIAGKAEIADAAALGGHSFGVGRVGSLDHSLSLKVLESAGVDTESLEIVSLGQPNIRAQALAAGQIDATTMSIGVWLSLPEKDGLKVLVDQDAYYEAAPVVNKVNVVTADVLENRRDELKGVIRALIKASRDFAADETVWVDAMSTALPDTPRVTLEELGQAFAQSWSINGGMSRKELEFSVDWVYQGEDFADLEPVALEDWADLSPLDEVLSELGVDDSFDPADR